MGIITGYVDVKAGEMWNKIYPKASSPVADLKAWVPDVVFVNLGDNDESFTEKQKQPFPVDFNDGYISLVRNIRGGVSEGAYCAFAGRDVWRDAQRAA